VDKYGLFHAPGCTTTRAVPSNRFGSAGSGKAHDDLAGGGGRLKGDGARERLVLVAPAALHVDLAPAEADGSAGNATVAGPVHAPDLLSTSGTVDDQVTPSWKDPSRRRMAVCLRRWAGELLDMPGDAHPVFWVAALPFK